MVSKLGIEVTLFWGGSVDILLVPCSSVLSCSSGVLSVMSSVSDTLVACSPMSLSMTVDRVVFPSFAQCATVSSFSEGK